MNSWGGARPNSGPKPRPNSGIPHLSRQSVTNYNPCLVTLKARKDVPSLRSGRFVKVFESSLRSACRRWRFRVVHYSIQGNHVHILIEAGGRDALGNGMKSVGARFARAVNRVFRRSGPVLADRYHLRVLRTPREVRNALAYVLLNARRHLAKAGKRLSGVALVDPASSGRWFDGWRERIERAKDPPAVAPAGTWLLSVGWRRRGLVSLVEVPGGRRARRRAS